MTNEIARLIEPDQVTLLLAISDLGSFSAAAARLGITPSSVSQQIKRLETLAGCDLFRRNRRGVELTCQGETLLIYARLMTGLAEDLKRHFRHGEGCETIGIGMGEDFCRTALPALLGLFAASFPHVDLRVVSGSYDLLARVIEEKAVDIVVMRNWDRFCGTTPFWTDRQVWYAHPKFRAPLEDPVPLVVPLAPNPTRKTLMDALRSKDRAWKVRFESVGMTGIEAALQCGMGLCGGPSTMPMHGAVAIGQESGLPPLPDVEFVMLHPSGRSGAAIQAVTEILQRLARTGFGPQ